jgi:DHA3 family macrolide efflux protein-like MFS transporter
LGSNVAQFALVWWVTKTTGSATVLATATLVALLPQVFLGPIVGALVDRWDRRRVMILADSAIALIGMVLVYLLWAEVMNALCNGSLMPLGMAVGGPSPTPGARACRSLSPV